MVYKYEYLLPEIIYYIAHLTLIPIYQIHKLYLIS